MLEVFRDNPSDDNKYETSLSIVDLKKVVELVLKYFLDEKNWNDYGQSIWEWETMLRSIANEISAIRQFLDEVEEEGIQDEDLSIIFYDSY